MPDAPRRSSTEILKAKSGRLYQVDSRVIRKGTNASVLVGKDMETGRTVALKVVTRNIYEPELAILQHVQAIQNPRLVKLLDVIENYRPDTCIFVFPMYERNLLEHIVCKRNLAVSEVRKIFGQVCEGIQALHAHNVAHLDIKLENIMLDQDENVVIIDFGLAEVGRSSITRFCGSYAYVAPELLMEAPYNPYKADCWSLGVLLFVLLCNYLPFDSNEDDVQKIFKKIRHQPIVIPFTVHPDACSLLQCLLERDINKRATIADIMRHRFLNPAPKTPSAQQGGAQTSAKSVGPITVIKQHLRPTRSWTPAPNTAVAVKAC
jgi:serine/threonine protein kinase